jgi:hypothetical protein
MVSTDFFVVPTATFRLLFVLLMLSHDRRRIVLFGVTAHPTAEWTAQQLINAFPWNSTPRCPSLRCPISGIQSLRFSTRVAAVDRMRKG